MSDLQCAARVLMARHGAAAYETDAITDAGGSLTPAGREQAETLAGRLRGDRVQRIHCSPMSRAVQTAEIVAARLDVGVDVREGLRELTVGAHEGQPEEPDPFAETFAAWRDGDLDARYDGGQSAREVIARMRAELLGIADLYRGETVLVISHGGVMSLALPRIADNLAAGHAIGRPLGDTALVRLSIDADGVRCDEWPDSDQA